MLNMIQQHFITVTLIAAAIIAPGVCNAAVTETCNATELRLSCSQKAADLLTGIEQNDRAVLHQIRKRRVDRMRTEANDMRERLNELQALQADLAPWEQRMIGQLTPLVEQLVTASDRESATPAYENLYAEASALRQTIRADAHAARVAARAEYLAPNLGMTELFR
jgi:cell division septum initiation protein DivIVA